MKGFLHFKAATLKVLKVLINFKSTLGKFITNQISVVVLLVEDFVQGALQKELFIAPFVERFKQSLREDLLDKY